MILIILIEVLQLWLQEADDALFITFRGTDVESDWWDDLVRYGRPLIKDTNH